MNLKNQALNRLGYEYYKPLQEEAIDALCSGQDVLLAIPTGGGKSLVYQSAGLIRKGVAVIVSPLLALMSQQVEELRAKGIQARFLNSTLNPGEQDDLVWSVRHNNIDLLFLSPEKLVQPSVIGFLHSFTVSLFAIDEAHCISQWGDGFRPEYSQLGQLREHFANVPIIALTGTVDGKTIDAIQKSLKLKDCLVLRSSFDRSNIEIKIAQKRKAKQQILHFLHFEAPGETGIVYCRSRKKAEEFTTWLNSLGFSSFCYHANMAEADKQNSHQSFVSNMGTIMVATTAYGMGIDIPHVRFIIHLDIPSSPEAYFQEIGRAGRDGKPAKSLLLYGLQDMLQAQQFNELQEGNGGDDKRRLTEFFKILESRGCRRSNLLAHFGEKLEACGNCDRCLSGTTEQNMTIAAQKMISLIYHTKGIQPISVLIKILVGKKTKATLSINTNSLNLFGKGKELLESQWKAVVRHLIAFQYITVGQFGITTIQINEKARSVLKGDEQIFLSQDKFYPALYEENLTIDTVVWHKLMVWKHSQDELRLNDSQMKQIYQNKPNSNASLSRLTGMSIEDVSSFSESLFKVISENESSRENKMC